MRERKSVSTKSRPVSKTRVKARSVSVKAKASSRKPNGHASQKLQVALKKANATSKELRLKLAKLNAEWRRKVKTIEAMVLEKARGILEREHSKREEARKKAIETAAAKFDKKFTKKHTRTTGKAVVRKAKTTKRTTRRKKLAK